MPLKGANPCKMASHSNIDKMAKTAEPTKNMRKPKFKMGCGDLGRGAVFWMFISMIKQSSKNNGW